MVVDAVLTLDDDLNIDLIGIKKETGGALEVPFITLPRRPATDLLSYHVILMYIGLRFGRWCKLQEDLFLRWV